MEPKTLEECFADLITGRAWYKRTGVDRKTAYRDKLYFQNGELPENKMRYYLTHAGYIMCQPELWIKKESD